MKMFLFNAKSIQFRINLIAISFLVLLNSCASDKLYVDKKRQIENKKIEQNEEVAYTFYLIGDAGNAQKDSTTIALKNLENKLNTEDKKSTVLFLGDNIYPKGLPEIDSEKRAIAEHNLNVQIDVVKKLKGKAIFLPGNHDWYNDGVKGLKRQQEYVENQLGKKSFLPRNGCPIETIKYGDDIVLILVDSEWYITNWDNHPTINDDCDIKTKDLFLEEFRSEIKKARGITTIVAIHHPMFTNGSHGGRFSFKSYFQPLPGLGILKNVLRKTTGVSKADIQNKHYNELKKYLVAASQFNDKVIFISGHEHNLQYLIQDNLPQIISGSGSKKTPVKNSKPGIYGHAANGFATLKVYKNGASTIEFINAENDSIEFATTIYEAKKVKPQQDFKPILQDSIKASIYSESQTKRSKFHTFLWGERYRKQYSVPVSTKTVDLDTLFGGLIPIRKGGGTQSKSLRLKDKDGKQYVIRALKKNASQYIQAAVFKDQYVEGKFKNTASEDLVQDVFTGSYPYAALTMKVLSDAINLSSLNTKLYYVPKQKALQEFNEEFGDELYMFEEHASDGHLELGGKNFTGEIISTYDVFKEIHSDESKIIDEKEYIKARLFDMLIGDWDRHQDQWRWLKYIEDGVTIFKPLPRDRDQSFSIMSDGFVLGAAIEIIPLAKILRKYNNDLKDVKGFNIEPFPLDMAIINQSNQTVWNQQVKIIQDQITDEVIDMAFDQIPDEVKDENINIIKQKLKARRENLQGISNRYYKQINKFAILTATNKDDYISIDCLENGNVHVVFFRKKGDELKDKFHDRIYKPEETKEIWIYALDDSDTFEVKGKSSKIKIRLIGGQNNDEFIVENGKNIIIYDYKSKKNDLAKAQKATIKLRDDYAVNVYDFKKFKNNVNQIIPVFGYNPDDGFKIGVADRYTRYGFERNPFSSQHQLKGAYYFATNGFELSYTFEVANVIKNLNFEFNTSLQSPNFTHNFFGYGNETSYERNQKDLNYNRVKVRSLALNPSLKWRSRSGSKADFQISYESIEVSNTANRFIENNMALPPYVFDEVQFLGTEISYQFENFDNKAYPTNGMKTAMTFGYKSNLDIKSRDFSYFIPEVSFTQKIDALGKLVLATQFKSHIVFGDDFEFYQGASIGGTDGLRGFRNQRFLGNSSFFNNTDLRYSFNSKKTNIIPVRFGVYGAFDYGRVWLKGENSNKWNNSYGAGFFVNGVEIVTANLGVFNSSDGIRVAFGLGFGF